MTPSEPFSARLPEALPQDKRAVLREALDRLRSVPGILGVALGGSYARGTQHPDSDVDLGLYYAEHAPFAIADVRAVTQRIAAGTPVVTDFYEWGPWVNGGAWIPTRAGKVDFLYRNLDQLRRVIADARNGTVHFDFAQQPPYGFHSVIYLAEIQAAVPLHDPGNILDRLKADVSSYPPLLKRTIVRDYLWAVEFTVLFARDFAARSDVYNTVGCMTRALGYLTQVLFALNERYFITDKGAIDAIAALPLGPPRYADRVRAILARPGTTPAALSQTVAALQELFRDVVSLTGDAYRPKYVLPGNRPARERQ